MIVTPRTSHRILNVAMNHVAQILQPIESHDASACEPERLQRVGSGTADQIDVLKETSPSGSEVVFTAIKPVRKSL